MTDDSAESSSVTQVLEAQIRYHRRGEGRPVVLLHPLRMQLEYFDPLCHELEDADLELISVDLPGHGDSTAPSVAYNAGYFTDSVEALLDNLDLHATTIVGESIGGSIALGLAARQCHRVVGVVAVNPYDYGTGGGIRRSSTTGNIVFTAMLLPIVGPVVARAGTRAVLRRVLEGGLYHPDRLSPELVDRLHQSGSRPGHARALRSLTRNWKSWIAARRHYENIQVPVTLVYGDNDWSNQDERDSNCRAIPTARTASIERCGHFSSLEEPACIATLVRLALGLPSRDCPADDGDE
jgi:pimeloyl-ACP methyl ester carboxylesterase